MAVEHRTTYRFARPVMVHPHTIRLRPAPHSRTPILGYSLRVLPRHHFVNWQQDPFGNYLARYVFPEPVTELDVTVELIADMTVINPFDFFVEAYAEQVPFAYPEQLAADLEPYLRPVDEGMPGSGPGPLVRQWLARHDLRADRHGPVRTVDFLVETNRRLQADIAYSVRMEHGVQTPDETLGKRLGSCRDSAWLLVSVLRELGLAARFVSGYLVQLAPDPGTQQGEAQGPAADFTDLHAWAEVYVPGAGWVGLDPTSGLFAGEGHIPLSATPHPASSAPITGATEPVEVSFEFRNRVTRVREDARVTAPYAEEQWSAVDRLGEYVDTRLAAGDVRLTMGGEPTFVAADGGGAPEWETEADGPRKRELARALAARLRARFAGGGLVHHGQGKWYPGEPLPRWQIQLCWRRDGQPVWQQPRWLDDPAGPPAVEPDSDRAVEAVRRLALGVAGRVGVPEPLCLPAFDDAFAALWEEVRRPEGAPVPGAGAPPPVEQLDQQEATPRGWVVPLFEDPSGEGWATTRWRTRRPRLFLLPGDSPLGLRLPLDSLAWEPPPDVPDVSPFADRPDLPPRADSRTSGRAPTAAVLDIQDAPRTAVTVEEREGHLCCFLPPLADLTRGLALVSAVEAAAAELGIPVVVEGYPLPPDPRLATLSVTPDPGVLEVNVQPSATWADLRDLTLALAEDARAVGLATEKFDLDGTHNGTGGGNHYTLGGPTAEDSPLLRRPDLLRSLLTFWQHHPSLSYVFAGRFVGPTSQAPRVDEGRHETLYELEIAFAELERVTAEAAGRGVPTSPWLVDRLLRHLLTDLTGNTHRSEFCVDKLYSPAGERGRLGLLEMRGFEMPPHPRMALVQALLVRALVARFWDEPYTGPLVRWGSRLHDRFLLPAFAAADLRDVVASLNRWLAATSDQAEPPLFDDAWLEPFWEFRFPRLGETEVAGVHLTLRQAVEPWHVLGEEVTLGGTARYVDSSVERVQVAATGLVEGRHVVTCNGVPVPLTASGTQGRFVAGVRYRAWAPWSALHPTMGVHSPLVFDLVDLWNERSLGGFTYHVSHPGGRSYDHPPVNAVEAESRRASRFQRFGHSAGRVDTGAWPTVDSVTGPPGTEYPTTVDLRRFGPGHPA